MDRSASTTSSKRRCAVAIFLAPIAYPANLTNAKEHLGTDLNTVIFCDQNAPFQRIIRRDMFKKTLSSVAAMFSITDEQAMWRVQMDDDAQAFALLMERWHDRIHGLCARMLGSVHTAEDIAQEVFARIFEKRKDYDPEKRFSTWLWRIAVNRCYDELRRVHRHPQFSIEHDEDEQGLVPEPLIETVSPSEHAVAREEAQVVRDALSQLPDMYRAVVVLRHYHGLKLREVAEVLGVPDGTVNSRMAEALSQLSRLLEPRFPDYKALRSSADKRTRDSSKDNLNHFTRRPETATTVTATI